MASLVRKARRQQQRDWTYDQYAKKKAYLARMQRIQKAKASFLREWQNTIENHVPDWAQFLARALLRPRYTAVIHKCASMIPDGVWFPTIRKWFIYLAFEPLFRLRAFLATFGTRTKHDLIEDKYVRMRVWAWWRLVFDGKKEI